MVQELHEWLIEQRKQGATLKEMSEKLGRSTSFINRMLTYYKIETNIEIPESAKSPTLNQQINLIDFSINKTAEEKRVVKVPLATAIELAQRCKFEVQ